MPICAGLPARTHTEQGPCVCVYLFVACYSGIGVFSGKGTMTDRERKAACETVLDYFCTVIHPLKWNNRICETTAFTVVPAHHTATIIVIYCIAEICTV